MKALVITPAYSHTHYALDRAVRKSGLPWLPLHEHSDLVRVRSVLLTRAVTLGAERVILVDADTVPADGVLETFAASPDVMPERALFGLYVQRSGDRWQVAVSDADAADRAVAAGEKFRVPWGGLGLCVIHRESLLRISRTLPIVLEENKAWWSPYCLPFTRGSEYFPEDKAFCTRLVESGTELWADPTLRAGHAVTTILTEPQPSGTNARHGK